MSRSIQSLYGNLSVGEANEVVSGIQSPEKTHTLYSIDDDTPPPASSFQAGDINHKKAISDQYYNRFGKNKNFNQNGADFLISDGSNPLMSRRENIHDLSGMANGGERRKIFDPLNANQNTNHYFGSAYKPIVLPNGAYLKTTTADLILASRTNYDRYKNRYNPQEFKKTEHLSVQNTYTHPSVKPTNGSNKLSSRSLSQTLSYAKKPMADFRDDKSINSSRLNTFRGGY